MTQGQGYTVAILVVVAILLSTSLTRLHGRVADLISAPGGPVTTTTVLTPTTPPSSPTSARTPVTTTPPRRPTLPPSTGAGVTPTPTSTPTTRPASPPTTRPDRPPPEEETPCPADDLVQGVRGILEQVDTLVGGIVPTAALVTTIAIVTGCSQTDPLVLALAALIEVGEGLPDLGLGWLELPVLPFLDIPAPLIDLLQPLRPLFDPICSTVGTVGTLLSQVGPSYPYPLDAAFAVSLFYITTTCGQIQGL